MSIRSIGIGCVGMWLVVGVVGGAHAQGVISINFTDNGDAGSQSGFLDPAEVAGAPGVRVANWNNVQTRDDGGSPLFDGVLGDNEAVRFDDGSAVGGGFTVAPSTINFSDRSNGSFTNDREMYNGVKDAFGGNFSVAVSNVPFAVYDVYCYMFDDGAGRIGTFTIGDTTYYCRGGVGMPNSDGAGYVISVDTESDGATLAAHDQGNYVKFSGLSGDFTLVADAIGLEGNLPRNKFSGFQIVEPAAGTATNLVLDAPVPDLLSGDPVGFQVSVTAELDTGESINVTVEPETSYFSTDGDVLTVTAIGRLDPGQAGTAELVIGYQGLSITQAVTVLGPLSVTVGIDTSVLYVGAVGGADPPAQATLEATFPGLGAVDVTAFDFVTFSGGPASVVAVTPDGLVSPVGPGDFDLTGTYAGASDTLTMAGTVSVFEAPALAGGRTAINLDVAAAGSFMTFRDLAGAPGVRSANWNAILVAGNTGSLSDLADSSGLVQTGTTANLSVSVINGAGYVRTPPTPTTNDSVMVSSIIDQVNTAEGATPDATLTVAGIPYAAYDVYCYTWNDATQPTRAGYFAVGGITNWIRNLDSGGVPANDGSNYIEARTEGSPATVAEIAQGNYVKFTGLQGSTLTMHFGAAGTNRISDAESGAPRLKVSGFQIVEVETGPSVSAVEVQGADLVIRWASTAGATYAVSTSSSLQPPDWTVAASNLPATPPENTYTQPGFVADQGFVRVEREVSPPLLETDFEAGAAGWTESGDSAGTRWELGDPGAFGPGAAHSGAACWGTNLAGNYTLNADVTLRSPLIDLTGIDTAILSFWHYYDIEPGIGADLFFDYGTLRIVDAGGTELAVVIANIAGSNTSWQPASYPLPPAALNQPVRLEFRLLSDDLAADYAGWYLDDVRITTP